MKISLIGFGNLGQGLTKVIEEKQHYLKEKSGVQLDIVSVVDSGGAIVNEEGIDIAELSEASGSQDSVSEVMENGELGTSALDVVKNVDSDIMVELTPTSIEDGEPGLTHIKEAMNRGKHVVTANKGPLVVAFDELKELEERSGLEFKYSATVGGAIPVLGLAEGQMSGDSISEIQGVLNGTTNYILTRMTEENVPFDVVLSEAQELGIAEEDPTLDIEGIDTAAKMTILANSLLDKSVKLEDVDVEGITRIGPEVTKLARESGNEIRLVGVANSDGLEVSPKLVSSDNPLVVQGSLNSVTLKTDLAREMTITGFGAGPRETSSALLGDIVDIYKSVEG